jgi:hypothetical protein
MAEMTDKCAHAHCHCPAGRDTGYCSEYCETAAAEEKETACQCGHPECHVKHQEPDL